jgi:hypothetical protein
MAHRSFLPRTAEMVGHKVIEAEVSRAKAGMLSGEEEGRGHSGGRKRSGERRHLDGFRPGADDQPYIDATQPSP